MSTITSIRRAKKDTQDLTDNYCIRIELETGSTLRYTDSIHNLTTTLKNQNGVEVNIPQVTYSSVMGFNLSAVGGNSNEAGVIDLEGVLGPLGYTREQIAQGLFDNARIYVFITDRNRPVEDEEKMFSGFWGETTMIDGRYITKFTSLISLLEVDTGRLISQFCDTKLGGLRCGVRMQAGTRLGGNAEEFDPLTSLSVQPAIWYDFSDDSAIVQSSGFIQSVSNKGVGEIEGMVQYGATDIRPKISDINGVQAGSFYEDGGSLRYFSNTTDLSSGSSSFYKSMLDNLTSNDMFIVAHNTQEDPIICFVGANTDTYGPIAEEDSLSEVLHGNTSNTELLRVYDSEINRVETREDFHNNLSSPFVFLSNSAIQDVSEVFGLGSVDSINRSAGLVGEILVYPQLRKADRLKVMKYLTNKWDLATDLKEISGQNDYDAKTRRVITIDGQDFVWFEAFGNGDMSALEPSFDSTLGAETIDGDITWKAIPARTIQLTTQQGYGTTSTFVSNEALPSDFTGIYLNAAFEVMTGPNIGTKGIILDNTLDTFTMNYPTLKQFTDGDIIKVIISCEKTSNACQNDYNNIHNFQGFDLPNKANIFRRGER